LTFVYRNPNALAPAATQVEMCFRGGRLYVTDERGIWVPSNDWALFVGLLRAQRDRAADGRPQ
jgi:hypothetical protein